MPSPFPRCQNVSVMIFSGTWLLWVISVKVSLFSPQQHIWCPPHPPPPPSENNKILPPLDRGNHNLISALMSIVSKKRSSLKMKSADNMILLCFSSIVGLVHRALTNPIKLNNKIILTTSQLVQQVLKTTVEITAEGLNFGNLAVRI